MIGFQVVFTKPFRKFMSIFFNKLFIVKSSDSSFERELTLVKLVMTFAF